MARPFKAPIPVYGTRGLFELSASFVEEAAGRCGVSSQLKQEPRLVGIFGQRLAVARLAVMIDLTRVYAHGVGRAAVDADAVDDHFLTHVHPHVAEAITRFRELDAVEPVDRSTLIQMTKAEEARLQPVFELSQAVSVAIRNVHPQITDSSLTSLLMLRDAKASCWHPAKVHGTKRRGRPVTPTRRAATWGTYITAWTLGSESLAVTVWNSLLLPQDFLWGIGHRSLPHGLAKYVDAKSRLVKHLRGLGILPERTSLTPAPPLPVPARAILKNMLHMQLAQQLPFLSASPEALIHEFGWDGLAMFGMMDQFKGIYKAVSQIGSPSKEVS